MKKTTMQIKTASSRGDVSPKKRQDLRSGSRVKRSARVDALAEPVPGLPEVIVESLEIVERKPELRAPMPVHLARMLEEETWWRVVPALKAEPEKQMSNDRFLPVEYRKGSAKRAGAAVRQTGEIRAAARAAKAPRVDVLKRAPSTKKRKASSR